MAYEMTDDLREYLTRTFRLSGDGVLFRVQHGGKPCEPREATGWLLKGYRTLSCFVSGRMYDIAKHRLVFFLATKVWPPMVDHRDRDITNNHPSNLRPAEEGQNQRNHGKYKTNRNGFPPGVCQRSFDGKFLASVQIDKRTRTWAFWKLEDAIACREKKAKELYGEFRP